METIYLKKGFDVLHAKQEDRLGGIVLTDHKGNRFKVTKVQRLETPKRRTIFGGY